MPDRAEPPLAFIYDRCHGRSEVFLDLRVEACRDYAAAEGLTVAGVWVDRGDIALLNSWRPRFDRLLEAVRTYPDRDALCLVPCWDRLSRDEGFRASTRARVTRAGGTCVTASGRDRMEPAS